MLAAGSRPWIGDEMPIPNAVGCIIEVYATIVSEDTTTSSSSRSPSASPSLRRAVKKRTMQLTSSLTSSLTGHVVDGLSDLNQRRWNSVR